jgi:hypothetical protein
MKIGRHDDVQLSESPGRFFNPDIQGSNAGTDGVDCASYRNGKNHTQDNIKCDQPGLPRITRDGSRKKMEKSIPESENIDDQDETEGIEHHHQIKGADAVKKFHQPNWRYLLDKSPQRIGQGQEQGKA